MKKRKRVITVIIAIPIVLLLLYPFTFLPHKLINIDPSNVSKIYIFDGNTGYDLEIKDASDINHIINNLNEVTFKKEKLAVGYMGYSFSTTIYDHNGKIIKELIINSDDTIRYKGFFYRTVNHLIDYDYIERLVRK